MTDALGVMCEVLPARARWRPGLGKATIAGAPTLGAALVDWATERPGDAAFYFHDRSDTWTELTVGGLLDRAAQVSAGLAERQIEPGDRIAVSLDTGPDLIAMLFGAMLHGAVPVLLEPPLAEGRAGIWSRRTAHALECVTPRLLVADANAHPRAQPLADSAHVELAEPSKVVGPVSHAAAAPPTDPDALAALQLTSGTIRPARAVTLTHRALFANAAGIAERTPYRCDDMMVSWLPLFHDLGLAGAVISAFLHRIPVALLPPMAFLLRPQRWLWAIHRFRGTLSPAPNFAYQLCVAKVPDDALEGLDLSSWRAMYNGAEMVSGTTLRLWQERFGRCGVQPQSMRPGYGMAELGLAVTLTAPGEVPRLLHVDRGVLAETGRAVPSPPSADGTWELVGAGHPLPGYDVLVVDETGSAMPDRVQGRILVRGPSLTGGYFADEQATEAAIRDGWLHTGDVGFLADGDMFVTGRSSDMLIVAGRNYHPYPAELAAASVPQVRPGGAAVVGVPDPQRGTDAVVVVVESSTAAKEREREALAEAVSRAVTDALGLRPQQVHVVRPGTLPRTPSGKLQRARIAAEIVPHAVVGCAAGDTAVRGSGRGDAAH